MELELYNACILYITTKTFPSTFPQSDRRRVKRTVKNLVFRDNQLFRGNLRILHSEENESVLREYHEKSGHPNVDNLYHITRQLYVSPYLRITCGSIVMSCVSCADDRPPTRSSGPMAHCSRQQRKKLCQKIEIPFKLLFQTTNHPDIDPTKFVHKYFDCQSPYN